MYEQKTEEILLPIVEEYGFELVDVEYVKKKEVTGTFVHIDKPGGIGVNDCEVVSRRLSGYSGRERLYRRFVYLLK